MTQPRRPGVVGVSSIEPRQDSRALRRNQARRLLFDSIRASAGGEDPLRTLGNLFRPSDVIGIKLNCLAGRNLSPRPVLVYALVDLLMEVGVNARNIILFERSSRELRRAGFGLQRGGAEARCYGIDNDFDRHVSVSGEIGSCFAKLVSTYCTALIGFGVVKDHDLAGVSASLKNWYGVIHNPNKYHDNNCDPYVADVVKHPFIAEKLRLTVLDGLRAQCQGGPAYRPDGVYDLGKVAVSIDPVAADVWAWRELDRERERRGLPILSRADREPRFIATADRYGLGVGDPESVQEVVS